MRPHLELRAALRRAIRSWLDARGFLEVETPVLIPAPAPEEFIETLRAGGGFLRPSPELEMKLLLGAGLAKIYQFGSCFRAGEHGRKHREEFTMLEYYEAGADYRQLAELTAGFIRSAARELFGGGRLEYCGTTVDLEAGYEWLTVDEAFRRYAGCSAQEALERDCFDERMVCAVEPQLGRGRLTFLTDYPVERAALARVKADNPAAAERWELYIAGIELANAYSELIDGAEQRRRFQAALDFRAAGGMQPYPAAEEFLAMMDAGLLPPCAGSALGFDRLAMIFAAVDDIGQVRAE
ncbi:amino acid--tRNA ligase-related protein [Victivallis sp. Marseille-Q1083]|uniref:amino acid--tRNA ligase-related protein n=1 Tax=Victivallis sp. Marseille-Q1083 TaxID=2717288 RepID=UPI00158F1D3C|nr:amino acid--tRNA ligase-related protein [Victivallis sp. Marseille-Q1083]